MLELEYLLEEAKDQGLPTTKRRAIIREYLHAITLDSIYKNKQGKKLYFMGGTALRYCWRLPRFSEDLDFNTEKLGHKDFKKISQDVQKKLEKEGFKTQIDHEKRGKLYTTYINFPQVMQKYQAVDKRGIDLMIKLEANQPHWPLKTKPQVISHYGYHYTATVMAESSLITEKLCALLNRKRGRDIYDLLFMLRKKFPFDTNILKAQKIKETPKKLIKNRLKQLEKELERLGNQVKPFLFKEDDTTLIYNAPQYAEKYLKKY